MTCVREWCLLVLSEFVTQSRSTYPNHVSIGLAKSSNRPNSLSHSLKLFLEGLPNPKGVGLPKKLIQWSGIFASDVQKSLRGVQKKRKQVEKDTPSFDTLMQTEVHLPTMFKHISCHHAHYTLSPQGEDDRGWSENYERQVTRDILQFIASRSVGYRQSRTDSHEIAKARVKSIVRRLLSHIKLIILCS